MRADDGDEVDQGDGFVVPPPPEAHPPRLSGEVRLDVVFPFEQDPLCPDGSACVFRGAGASAVCSSGATRAASLSAPGSTSGSWTGTVSTS